MIDLEVGVPLLKLGYVWKDDAFHYDDFGVKSVITDEGYRLETDGSKMAQSVSEGIVKKLDELHLVKLSVKANVKSIGEILIENGFKEEEGGWVKQFKTHSVVVMSDNDVWFSYPDKKDATGLKERESRWIMRFKKMGIDTAKLTFYNLAEGEFID